MNKRLIGFGVLVLNYTAMVSQVTESENHIMIKDSINIQELDEVVVSDSRFDLKRENSGKTVIKISREELEKYQGSSVANVLNTKSGIEINGSRSYSGQPLSVYARGGNNRQVLVLIDGIQVSDPSGVNAEFDLRLLNTEQIENIEILKGASSTLYGNSAATMVINITTRKPKENGSSLLVNNSFGTNQSQEEQDYDISNFSNTVQYTGNYEKLSLLLSGGHQFTDGLSAALDVDPDAFSRLDGNIRLGYRFNKKFNVSLSGYYHKIHSDFDNGFPVEDADFTFFSENTRFSMSSIYKYKKGSLTVNASHNQIKRDFVTNFPYAFDSQSLIFDAFNKYTFNDKLHTIVGVNLIDHTTRFSSDVTSTSIDPYVNAVYLGKNGVNLNVGARLNNHSDYGSNLIYSINPSYRFKTEHGYVKFLGAYASSFIAPNLSQLYGPFGANTGLDPETDTTFEGGVEFSPTAQLRLSAVYFNRVETNRIDYVLINEETFEYQYRNLTDKVKFNGVELELLASPWKDFDITANYTYTDADEGLAFKVPRSKGNISLDYMFNEKTFMSLAGQYVSKRSDTSAGEIFDLEAYSLFNFFLKQKIGSQFSCFVDINNILNKDYVEVVGYTTLGRNIRLGFTLNL